MPKLTNKSHAKVGINSYVTSYVIHQLPGRVFTHDQLIERKGITEDQRSATLKALSRMVSEKKSSAYLKALIIALERAVSVVCPLNLESSSVLLLSPRR